MSALYDPGLQPERTELAWRRTSLALAVGSLVAMRMFPATLGGVGWVVPGLVGLVCAGALWQAARHRTARVNDVLPATLGGVGSPGVRCSAPSPLSRR